MNSQEYDAIVIGSGMGGMATASLLAQMGGKTSSHPGTPFQAWWIHPRFPPKEIRVGCRGSLRWTNATRIDDSTFHGSRQ